MKPDSVDLKKGDSIQVQIYDLYGTSSRFRLAEVIKVIQLPDCKGDALFVIVHYLDVGNLNYECVSLDRIKGFCDE